MFIYVCLTMYILEQFKFINKKQKREELILKLFSGFILAWIGDDLHRSGT